MQKQIAIAGLIGLMSFGCQSGKQPVAAATPPAAPAQPMIAKDTTGRVILHIVSRHETITVKSGEHGVVYTIHGPDGKLLLADATGAEFEKVNPQLYQQIQHYIAVQADAGQAFDAADIRSAPFADSVAR